MPSRAMKFCPAPGCSVLVARGLCPAHAAERQEKLDKAKHANDLERGSASARGYDGDWAKLRATHLARHPLCEKCRAEGRLTPAVLVHHARRIREGGARLDSDNLMSMCDACHDETHKGHVWKRTAKKG